MEAATTEIFQAASAFSWARAGGRAEAERLDFRSFGAGVHEDGGVPNTCWVVEKMPIGVVVPARRMSAHSDRPGHKGERD